MKFVVQICISVIQIRTSVKKFSVYIIQIKIRVESIQLRHVPDSVFSSIQIRTWAFKFVISSFSLACILRIGVLYSYVKTKCLK